MQDAEYLSLDARISAVISRLNAIEERQRSQEIRIRIFDSIVGVAKRVTVGIAAVIQSARDDVQRINAKSAGQQEIDIG